MKYLELSHPIPRYLLDGECPVRAVDVKVAAVLALHEQDDRGARGQVIYLLDPRCPHLAALEALEQNASRKVASHAADDFGGNALPRKIYGHVRCAAAGAHRHLLQDRQL